MDRQGSWTAEGRFSQFLAPRPTKVRAFSYEMIDSMCMQQPKSEHAW